MLIIFHFIAGFNINIKSIDLGQVRLCFQLKLNNEMFFENYLIPPIVSQVISTSNQKISILIENKFNLEGSVNGGSDVCLFVKRLEKDQKPIFAVFFDENGWSQSIEIDNIHYKVN